jgi:hypothetical protein
MLLMTLTFSSFTKAEELKVKRTDGEVLQKLHEQ